MFKGLNEVKKLLKEMNEAKKDMGHEEIIEKR